MTPRILTLDLETSPIEAHVWAIWQQNVAINQIMRPTAVIAVGSKWHGEDRVLFESVHHHGHEEMILASHKRLDEADIVVHFNGKSFDIPHLNREFAQMGLTPPSPYRQVDLKQVVARQFRFPSNKLAYVTKALGLSGKLSHTGHEMWVQCMAGDEKAWNLMRRYCKQDVRTTEELFDRVRPWVPALNVGLYTGDSELVCPSCGSGNYQRRGEAVSSASVFQQYRCECGKWFRTAKSERITPGRPL